jgi:hypothetical protein
MKIMITKTDNGQPGALRNLASLLFLATTALAAGRFDFRNKPLENPS